MKKTAAWLLACMLMLVSICPAFALADEEALQKVSVYLTEVYGYSVEEAAAFEAHVAYAGKDTVIDFYPKDHPEWRYTAVYEEENQTLSNVMTPFLMQGQYHAYPGEGAVRMGLREAREQGWFSQWDDQARQALVEYMVANGMGITQKLNEGMMEQAGEALYEYFVASYGQPTGWTWELYKWYETEMESYGLSYSKGPAVEEGSAVWQEQPSSGQKLELTRFIGEVPEELETLFAHPRLKEWTCLCGALMRGVENNYAYGLAAFEKEEQRLLVALKREVGETEWKLSPISDKALYTDKELYITPVGSTLRKAEIVYQLSETETERFMVTMVSPMDGSTDVRIDAYRRMDEATGNGFWMDLDAGVITRTYQNHRKTDETKLVTELTRTMSMMDIDTFPTTQEALEQGQQTLIPEGYAMVRGVHLRKRTSSRSKDLGEYNGGVLAKVIGVEEGHPDPWYHVQIGRAEGYMSSQYVNEPSQGMDAYEANVALPFAQAQNDIRLKSSPGWLSTTVLKVPQGTLMHVLADCDGGWLHVSIPQDEIGWQMDVNGIDGYVKKKDVQLASTPLKLEWGQ